MPYDIFVSEQDHASLYTQWEFLGTHDKLHDAKAAVVYHGRTQPRLQRWTIFYIRRKTAKQGTMHSHGAYTREEETHAEV